ncbi:hypothetical protein BJF90_13450 [Pseudonocardia sp. CNS-004]|nr:hypothetical protein BJF90_13450 [Pseudonocardia sp. CNS-004]
MLAVRGVAKAFGPTKALSDASLAVRSGEVVALLGENGSGKSTLVKVLSGVVRPDAGELVLDGRPVRPGSPRDTLRAGIVTVYQEILVAPDLTVLDNLWLGSAAFTERSERARRRARAREVLDVLSPDPIALDGPVSALDLMQQQVCVIAQALLRDPRLLVLDEATSTLDVTLRDRLMAEVRRRCDEGAAALFISHRMDEVLAHADRFVALRGGVTVGELPRSGADAETLVRLVSGEEATAQRRSTRRGGHGLQRTVLEVSQLRIQPSSEPLDGIVRAGEIIGLAGLEGHGQDEFLQCLAGLRRPAAGEVVLRTGPHGAGTTVRNYRQAVRAGMAYVPRNRKTEGIAGVLSNLDNFTAPTLRRDARLGLLGRARRAARYRRFAEFVNLTAPPGKAVVHLSGGNQQKVIVSRWLAREPSVLLLNDPTRGVDLRTKQELYGVLERLADQGTTIVMLSTEVEELIGLMDRVLVFHGGSCAAVLDRSEATRERLVSAYFGHGSGATGSEEVR